VTQQQQRGVEREEVCTACGQVTKTIGGRCPNCGAVKDPARMPATSPAPRLDPWGTGWLAILVFGSAGGLIVLGAILVAPELLIGLALLAVLYGLLNGLFEL
jgi:hypothetical protein